MRCASACLAALLAAARASACVLAVLCAACASPPPRTSYEGEEEVGLMAKTDHWLGQTIDGARCALSNDKGSWSIVTTGTARVQRSMALLRIECVKDGYEPALVALKCVSPRERAKLADNFAMGIGAATIPVAIAAAPLFPGYAALIATQGTLLAGGAAAHQASEDICAYGGTVVVMKRAR